MKIVDLTKVLAHDLGAKTCSSWASSIVTTGTRDHSASSLGFAIGLFDETGIYVQMWQVMLKMPKMLVSSIQPFDGKAPDL